MLFVHLRVFVVRLLIRERKPRRLFPFRGASVVSLSGRLMPDGRGGATLAPVTELDDRIALERWRSGTAEVARAAFRQLYERYFDEVHRFVRRLLQDGHAADDAVQETFVRLHRGLATIDPARPLRPFVLTVARNVAIDALRARAKRPKELPEDERHEPAVISEAASERERRAAIADALAALAPEHRSILVLRHVEGLKLEEIAEGASCTVRTARNRLRAAGALLGRELKRRGLAPEEGSP
jgi:RNA polymerase sigma-70 factor (ECF subfamily)